MIPKYPYQVVVDECLGSTKTSRRVKSFESLSAAAEYARTIKRAARVKRVQITMTLEEMNGSNGDSGGD